MIEETRQMDVKLNLVFEKLEVSMIQHTAQSFRLLRWGYTLCKSRRGESVMQNREMITKKELKERGWTDATIRDYLGQPDALKLNPYFRSGPKMQLYSLNRINQVEQKPEVVSALEGARKRSESAKMRAATQMAELKKYIDTLQIEVPTFSEEKIIEEACNQYNKFWSFCNEAEKYASPSHDEDFLHRITVNYLRHEMTIYEPELDRMSGLTGSVKARLLLKERILDQIAEVYPFLESECERQKDIANEHFFARN